MKKSIRNPHLTVGQKLIIQKHMLRPEAWKVLYETDKTLTIECMYHKDYIRRLDKSVNLWEQGVMENAS